MLITTRDVQIEWGDCDPSGLVFHPRYFAMFDWSLAVHFAKAGLPKTELVRRFGAVGFPSVDARASFLKPLRYGAEVVIETRITRFGRSSFDVAHRMLRDGEVAVKGGSVRVWTMPDPARPGEIKGTPIPPEVVALFNRA